MRSLTVLWLCAFLTASAGQAATLYGITLGNRNLIAIDTATGAGTLVGNIPFISSGAELGATGGDLYAFDLFSNEFNTDRFARINPANADFISTATAGIDVVGEGGMAFRPDGRAFLSDSGVSSGTLFLCDVTINDGCSLVATLPVSMDGLALASNGTLYGLSQDTSQLYTIDTSTGASTLVGSSGMPNTDDRGGLTFGPGDILYAAFDDSLWTFNTATGAATLIGAIGFNDVAGITYLDTLPVPEPGTLILLTGALAGLLWKRRWNRSFPAARR